MSKTYRKGKRPAGWEYWKSRLHRGGEIPGSFTKKLTHKKERRQNKDLIQNQYLEDD